MKMMIAGTGTVMIRCIGLRSSNTRKTKIILEMDLHDPHSKFDKSNFIHPTAIIHPCVEIGKNNVIGAYTVIGSNGEIRDTDMQDFEGKVIIGDANVISEHVTIQRPLNADEITTIGDENIIMAHSHIGHNAKIESNVEICTGTIIGGYCVVKDYAKIKLQSVIRNRRIVGEGAIVGMGSVVVRNVLDGHVVKGNPARPNVKPIPQSDA